MDNNQCGIVEHAGPFYYELCFFERPYTFFTYESAHQIDLYCLVLVSFARTERVGIVFRSTNKPSSFIAKEIKEVLTSPLLTALGYKFIVFCSDYYISPIQEVLATAIPAMMRKKTKKAEEFFLEKKPECKKKEQRLLPILTQEQTIVIDASENVSFHIHLIEGVTGSGKTRCYLELMKKKLENNDNILLMVPEINLTPQLIESLQVLDYDFLFIYHSHYYFFIKKCL